MSASNGWWAQEDAEMLRSLVVPLEAEIKALKDKLRATDDQLRAYEAAQSNMFNGSATVAELVKGRTPTEVVEELDEKLKELNEDLKAEKSSRSDLEMYVAVLQTQKLVLQDDAEKLRNEIQEVCRLLEIEKREHNDLKQTWQRANDYFLESQRLHFGDLRRMRSLLTMEQQRQLEEMKKREEDRQTEEKSDKSGLASPILSRFSVRRRLSPSPHREQPTDTSKNIPEPLSLKDILSLDRSKAESTSSIDSVKTDHLSESLPCSESQCRPTQLFGSLPTGIAFETSDDDSVDCSTNAPLSERIPSLTDAQFKALADITPEQEMRKQLLHNARTRPETLISDTEGKRFVSEKEWLLLHDEVKRARDKLSRTCDMCSNYEAQLQNVQEHEKDLEKRSHQLSKLVEQTKEELTRELSCRKELEEKFASMAAEAQTQVMDLTCQLKEKENVCTEMQQKFRACYDSVQEQMKLLSQNRDHVQTDLIRLQTENDSLVGKHSAHAQQMQNEEIDLPSDINEMYHLLLKMREELIAAKVAKEHTEETLKSEIMFLKDHVKAEHQLKDNLEDTLTQEIDSLRTQVGICESIKQQFEEERKKRGELERMIREQEDIKNNSKHIIISLQKQSEELSAAKASLENEIHQLKCKVQALQVELENGEAVQRDFVKLSQSLQVQLEKIRDSENEVRWQHEEDIVECTNCKQPFHGPTRKRRHCRHCGKIFCFECTSKVVLSGPNNRQSRVCDVCHTLLVPNTAPYFSKEPPHTPD